LPPLRLAIVQWSGALGGAEVLAANWSDAWRRIGLEPTLIFVTDAGLLGDRLAAADVEYCCMGLQRGRDVVFHLRKLAQMVGRDGPDGALLPECGFIGVALRLGGYRGPIVAVEHGGMLLTKSDLIHRMLRRPIRLAASWADDVEVAVSEFMLSTMRAGPHAGLTRRIYNGVDPRSFAPAEGGGGSDAGLVTIGSVGRLRPGKGMDCLIRAFAQLRTQLPARLVLAGDGPARARLELLVRELGLQEDVEFLGWVMDVAEHWRGCDIAVFPPDRWPEPFGLAALEAMACGKPVVASRIGALPEIVVDGDTGHFVSPGDVDELAAALARYAADPELRHRHGAAGRRRAIEVFHINTCAEAYAELFLRFARQRTPMAPAWSASPSSL